MSSGSIAGNGVGVRELGWCAGGVPRVAKNREKAKRKLRPPFFRSIDHHRHFPEALRDVAVRATCGHHGLPIRYTAFRHAYGRATPARWRLNGQNLCFWGRFRQVKNGDFIFAIFFRDFSPLFTPPERF